METILLIFLTLITLYLIFQHRCMNREIEDLQLQVEGLRSDSVNYAERIRKLESKRYKDKTKRGEYTNKYSRLLKASISKCIVYCNNGWSVSKTLLTKAKSKANRIFKGGKRFTYIRAERFLLWIVYRTKERQEVLSYCRAKAVYIKSFGQGVLRNLRQRFRTM